MSRRLTYTEAVTCCPACADGLREDDRHGLIYGPWVLDGRFVNRHEWAAATSTCIYDGAPLPRGRAAYIRRRWMAPKEPAA